MSVIFIADCFGQPPKGSVDLVPICRENKQTFRNRRKNILGPIESVNAVGSIRPKCKCIYSYKIWET